MKRKHKPVKLNIRAWMCVRGKPPVGMGPLPNFPARFTSYLESGHKHKNHTGECNPAEDRSQMND